MKDKKQARFSRKHTAGKIGVPKKADFLRSKEVIRPVTVDTVKRETYPRPETYVDMVRKRRYGHYTLQEGRPFPYDDRSHDVSIQAPQSPKDRPSPL